MAAKSNRYPQTLLHLLASERRQWRALSAVFSSRARFLRFHQMCERRIRLDRIPAALTACAKSC
jgi:hypothetical protein